MLVASAKMGFRKTRLRLMRDPRARTPEELAAESGVDLADYDLDIEEFVSPALGLGQDSQVRAVPQELLDLARKLAVLTLLFEQDTENLSAGQEKVIREAGSLIATIVEKAGEMGFDATVEITGHAAGTIQDDESVAISLERARKAMDLFASLNKPLVKYVGTRGVGVVEPVVKNETTEEDRIKNRSVSFKALFR
jgi:outer membrane protein OmpA-like peptidoglycan-associated protein